MLQHIINDQADDFPVGQKRSEVYNNVQKMSLANGIMPPLPCAQLDYHTPVLRNSHRHAQHCISNHIASRLIQLTDTHTQLLGERRLRNYSGTIAICSVHCFQLWWGPPPHSYKSRESTNSVPQRWTSRAHVLHSRKPYNK